MFVGWQGEESFVLSPGSLGSRSGSTYIFTPDEGDRATVASQWCERLVEAIADDKKAKDKDLSLILRVQNLLKVGGGEATDETMARQRSMTVASLPSMRGAESVKGPLGLAREERSPSWPPQRWTPPLSILR